MALTYETSFRLPEDLDKAFYEENIPRQAFSTLSGFSNVLRASHTESIVEVALSVDLTVSKIDLDFSFSPPTPREKKGGQEGASETPSWPVVGYYMGVDFDLEQLGTQYPTAHIV